MAQRPALQRAVRLWLYFWGCALLFLGGTALLVGVVIGIVYLISLAPVLGITLMVALFAGATFFAFYIGERTDDSRRQ